MFKNKCRAMLLFDSAIKSVQTRKVYGICLGKFLKWTGIKSIDELTALKPQTLQIMVADYIIDLRKNLNPNSIPPQFDPIELFFSMNDIALNWKKVRDRKMVLQGKSVDLRRSGIKKNKTDR